MSDGKQADHWGSLVENIGAKPTGAASQPLESAGKPEAATEHPLDPTDASVEGTPASTPKYTPPRAQVKQPPKPRASAFGSGWDKLAGEFGIETPPPPAKEVTTKVVDAPQVSKGTPYRPGTPYKPSAIGPIDFVAATDELSPVEHAEELPAARLSDEESAEPTSLGVEVDDRSRRPRGRSRHSARSEAPRSEGRSEPRRSERRSSSPAEESSQAHPEVLAELAAEAVHFDDLAVEFSDDFSSDFGSSNEEFDDLVEGDGVQGSVSGGQEEGDKSRPRRRRRRRGRGRSRDGANAERSPSGTEPSAESLADQAVSAESGIVDDGPESVETAEPAGGRQRSRRGGGRNRRDSNPRGRQDADTSRRPTGGRSGSNRPHEGRYDEPDKIDHDDLVHDFEELGDEIIPPAAGEGYETGAYDDLGHDDPHDELGHEDLGHDHDEHDDADTEHLHADDEHGDDFTDEDDDDVESPRIGFRNIPTWHEAVGVLVGKNMESRARNPAGKRGYGGGGGGNRGGRGGRGRGRRPDGRGDKR